MKAIQAVLALAVSSALLCACQRADDVPLAHVQQLNALHGPVRDLAVELHEGTNMAASPSPDGKRIVFSMQGALWIIPATGGAALRITGWELEATHPVWSPDGQRIAFQNYAPEGNYHIWTIAPDGRAATEWTSGPHDDREPAWLADGSALVFASDRSMDGQYKIWQLSVRDQALRQLTHGRGAESNPAVSPDGRQLAYVDRGTIHTLALEGGAPQVVGPGMAPAWTPDGSSLVYQNGARQLVVAGRQVTRDEDMFPFPVRFLANGRFLYSADGKLRTRAAGGGDRVELKFNATMLLRRPGVLPGRERGFDKRAARPVRGVSAPVLSPDGSSVAFVALNDVWVMKIGQDPQRLTHDTDRDAGVQWRADGGALYFSSDRGNGGQLAIDQVHLATRARTRLAALPGRSMANPRISPSGRHLAYTTLGGQLEVWDLAAGRAEVIAPSRGVQVSTPSWTADGKHIMVVDNEPINNRFREGYNKLRVIDLAMRHARFYAVAAAPRQVSERDEGAAVLSPDGSQVAFIMDSVLHVMAVNPDGSPAGAATALTTEAADLPSWSGDGRTILYKSAHKLKLVSALGGAAREVALRLDWSAATPEGSLLIRAGRLWDGVSATVQRDVDILVTGNRIMWIRARQDGAETLAERFLDASALTVMPGLWDSKLHPVGLYHGGQFGQVAALMLAYGITSAQSTAGPLHQGVELREALDAGNLVGPRLFVAPPLWDGNRVFYSFARSLRTARVADLEIAKARAMGADYMMAAVRAPIPVMSRIAQGALELGVQSGTSQLSPGAATGIGSTTELAGTQRMGYGWSRSAFKGITYQDAHDLYGKGEFRLLDSLSAAAALSARDPAILDDPRMLLVPPHFVAALRAAPAPGPAVLAGIRSDAQQQAKVIAAGALVSNGSDTPLVAPGIALHMNLRAAGMVMSNHQALQTVTINSARYARLEQDLGSVEPGKLADLVAVHGNPLRELAAAANVVYVVKNGNLFTQAQIREPFRLPAARASQSE